MNTPKHDNSGKCPRCQMIFDKYAGFHAELRAWFEAFQAKHPEGHISCAGRGHDEQETLFNRKATKAHWGQSAHNWNAAIDVFCMIPDNGDIYDRVWFYQTLAPEIPAQFSWYGRANAPFPEMPHIEIGGWPALAARKEIHLVEEIA
jgi:hypothetical protein